ncbi:MAG: hypothetical protein GY870_00145 [archaeon]|nr:hypothetical protein [archaeon]
MEALVFPGCVIPNRYPFLEKSARMVFEKLGISLVDAPFSCCPDPVGVASISEKTWLALGARNLSLAEKENKKIISLCNGCSETLLMVKHALEHDEEGLKEINEILGKKGIKYSGNASISHFVRSLVEDVGIEKIKSLVTRPLKGLKIATHTGCHYNRPSDVIQWDDPLNPICLDDLVKAIGAEPVEYEEKTQCCGAGVARTDVAVGLEFSKRKYKSLTDANAQCMATGCPQCFQTLESNQRLVNKKFETSYKVPVFYITELIALAFGYDPKELGLKFHSVKGKKLLASIGIEDPKNE